MRTTPSRVGLAVRSWLSEGLDHQQLCGDARSHIFTHPLAALGSELMLAESAPPAIASVRIPITSIGVPLCFFGSTGVESLVWAIIGGCFMAQGVGVVGWCGSYQAQSRWQKSPFPPGPGGLILEMTMLAITSARTAANRSSMRFLFLDSMLGTSLPRGWTLSIALEKQQTRGTEVSTGLQCELCAQRITRRPSGSSTPSSE